MINNHIAQPLLTENPAKGNKIKQAKVLKYHEDIRIKYFREINLWLQNDWHQSVKLLPENQDATQLSSENENLASEKIL